MALRGNEYKEKMEELKQDVSILEYGEKYLGLTPVKARSKYYSFKEHDSLLVDPIKNCFYRNRDFKQGMKASQNNHSAGSIIDFMMHMEGISLSDASKKLMKLDKDYDPEYTKKKISRIRSEKNDGVFRLPAPAKSQTDACNYLYSERKLSKEVLNYLVKHGYLYQQQGKYNNAVFVGYNDYHKAVFAMRQSIDGKNLKLDVKNSNYERCFYIDNRSNVLIVTEAIIDTCSIMTLLNYRGDNFRKYNHLGLAGVNKIVALFNILEDFPNINEVWLALDNDTPDKDGKCPGQETTQIAVDTIRAMGWTGKIKNIVNNDIGEVHIKDYNDLLKYYVNCSPVERHNLKMPFEK